MLVEPDEYTSKAIPTSASRLIASQSGSFLLRVPLPVLCGFKRARFSTALAVPLAALSGVGAFDSPLDLSISPLAALAGVEELLILPLAALCGVEASLLD